MQRAVLEMSEYVYGSFVFYCFIGILMQQCEEIYLEMAGCTVGCMVEWKEDERLDRRMTVVGR